MQHFTTPPLRLSLMLWLAIGSLGLAGCAPTPAAPPFSKIMIPAERETLTQISTLDALLGGLYDGELSTGALKQYGDFGLGTFEALDGEMLVVDGQVYQITADGKVHQVGDDQKTPFAAVTFFEVDQKQVLKPGTTLESFTKDTDQIIPTPNNFYAVKVSGKFSTLKVRSVPKQTKPYRLLAEITKTQPVFTFENIEGILVGFRSPPYVKGLNVPGYHLHFISNDRKSGGHVLDFTVQEGIVELDHTTSFAMILPQNEGFSQASFGGDTTTETKQVEK